jgi:hypothetical protein
MSSISRSALVAVLLALALGLAACGDDEDEPAREGGYLNSPAQTATDEAARTATSETGTAPEGAPEEEGGGAKAPSAGGSPEESPDGAGDEIPASSQALITGRGGKLSPAVVRVPPFIAVRVELRSADGVEYELSARGRTVKAGGEIQSASTLFEGLRPGDRLVLSGPQGRVTVEPSAEPGP